MGIAALRLWLDERLSISTLGELARKKEVPLHRHSIWYYLDGIATVSTVVDYPKISSTACVKAHKLPWL